MTTSPTNPHDVPLTAPPGSPDADRSLAAQIGRALAPYNHARWQEDLAKQGQGVDTGFDALRDLDMEWLPGKVYAVIARSGGGKTAFLLEAVCRYLAANPDNTALFLSWEEPITELYLRLFVREDGQRCLLPEREAFTGEVLYRKSVREWGREGAAAVGWLPDRLDPARRDLGHIMERLRIVDGDALGHDAHTVLTALATWLRGPEAPRVGLVAVDYFQKLRATPGAFGSRQTELQAVSDLLRRFAKGADLTGANVEGADTLDARFAVPVLVGAQVTRGGEAHPTGDLVREADDLLFDVGGLIALSWEPQGTSLDPRDEARALRVSVPKHRDGRARIEEVARYSWRPARGWIAPEARQDEAGRVAWTRLDTETPAPKAKPGKKQPSEADTVRPSFLPQ